MHMASPTAQANDVQEEVSSMQFVHISTRRTPKQVVLQVETVQVERRDGALVHPRTNGVHHVSAITARQLCHASASDGSARSHENQGTKHGISRNIFRPNSLVVNISVEPVCARSAVHAGQPELEARRGVGPVQHRDLLLNGGHRYVAPVRITSNCAGI